MNMHTGTKAPTRYRSGHERRVARSNQGVAISYITQYPIKTLLLLIFETQHDADANPSLLLPSSMKGADCAAQPPEWICCDTVSSRGLVKGGSAPLGMAWEPVSGLPVSTHSGWGRLMRHAGMKGQMGERDCRDIKKRKVRTGENNTSVRGG